MESNTKLTMNGGANPMGEFTQALTLLNIKETNNSEFQKILESVIKKYNKLQPNEKTSVNDLIQKSKHNEELYKKIPLSKPASPPASSASPVSSSSPVSASSAASSAQSSKKYRFESVVGSKFKIVQTLPDGTESIYADNLEDPTTDMSGVYTSINTTFTPDPINGDLTSIKTYKIDKDGKLEITETNDKKKLLKKQKKSAVSQDDINAGIDYSVESPNPEDNFLLELFDKNINNLVIDLKKHFGDNNAEVNQVVAAISTITSGIKSRISTDVSNISTTDDYATDKLIEVKDVTKGIYGSDLDKKHSNYNLLAADSILNSKTIKSLDDNDPNNTYKAIVDADPTKDTVDLDTTLGIQKVQKRLENCQGLELVHLGLYENFMKTGAFTLTLFEKYKYVTNVMLYLLKNLVDKPGSIESSERNVERTITKENECATQKSIQLPKEIIKNISQLVGEQGKIQGTIDDIDAKLKDTKMDNIMDYRISDIEANIKTLDSPDNLSAANTGTPAFITGPISSSPPKLDTI
jgi:hypothetical protein